jgi:hypothetical protein
MESENLIRSGIVGLPCTDIIKHEFSWHLIFGGGSSSLNLECPWRLLVGGHIHFGNEDDGQQFGLPEPIDGINLAKKLIGEALVSSVIVRRGTGDLTIEFKNGNCLEAFNHSGGYEGWVWSSADRTEVIAGGGGRMSICKGGGQIRVGVPDFT